MALLHVTDDEFQKVINENDVVLVDFFANWCGPCKMIGPILEELANDGHVIAKIDVDANPKVAGELGVVSIPTLVVYKDGNIYKKHVGFAAKPQILELLK